MITRRSFLELAAGAIVATTFPNMISALTRPCYSGDMCELEKGLWYGEFKSAQPAIVGDSIINIVRVDPADYDLKLLTKSQYKGDSLTAQEWVEKYNLVAAINAGMFRGDHKTNCGFARTREHVNNGSLTPKYNTAIAFNPKIPGISEFKMADLDAEDFGLLKKQYHSIVQNLRMTDRNGRNTWTKSHRQWSQAAVGIDSKGRILFLHSRSPHSIHDFNEIARALPLEIRNSMHVEGGPEASLSLRYEGKKPVRINQSGSYETGFNEKDSNYKQWPIPNVLGIIKRVA